jgi:outer membrane protein OmpA-like peptidoglycan-associated protein
MSVHNRAWGLCLAAVMVVPVWAAEPDTRSMIEALLPQAQRGTRNLVVRQKPEAVAAPASAASAPDGMASAPSAPEPVVASVPAATPAAPASLSLAIQFESNSARVRPESGAMLGNLVAAMQSPELKTTRFIIEGHSDARGAAAQNLRLSQERADEVRLYLVALGVHPARLRAVGKGGTEPANPADPAAPENRRVRVVTVE